MDMVAELLSDTTKIRPNSPSIRPTEKPVNKGFSPHSPHSPPGRGKTEKKAQGYGCAGCGNRIYEMVQEWEISKLQYRPPGNTNTPLLFIGSARAAKRFMKSLAVVKGRC
jgi:hypothetical protein